MTAYSPKCWPMAMEDQLSLVFSAVVHLFRLISKNHKRKDIYLTNIELLYQHCVTASWSRVILVLVLPGLTMPCGRTENGMLVP